MFSVCLGGQGRSRLLNGRDVCLRHVHFGSLLCIGNADRAMEPLQHRASS